MMGLGWCTMNNSEMIMEKIIETIQADAELSGISVECRTQVEGRTASYPVDLLLSFLADNGVHYKIIIKTQNIDKELDKNELFHFASLLQDISGQVMGVIFTQPVYDKLVQDVAKDVGIMLYEMRNMADKPIWEAGISEVKVDVDKEWVKAEKERLHLGDTLIQSGGNPKFMYLYENDICFDSIEGIFNGHIKRQSEQEKFDPVNVYHSFDGQDVFLKTDHETMPMVKLKGIGFTINFRNISALDGAEIVRNILRTAVRAKLN